MDVTPEEKPAEKPPTPLEFDMFLPWACGQLRQPDTVNVKKVIQTDYVSTANNSDRSRAKAKSTISKVLPADFLQQDETELSQKSSVVQCSDIQVTAIYDTSDHLVKLIFRNNKYLPRIIFKILNLIIQFHTHLYTITINRGLNLYTLYEISKFLPNSQITDICLDGASLKAGNCHLLLETKSMLKNLSLRRCSINDEVLETIANALVYPCPASKTLSILNLASNRITDKGAEYLAEALRSNRQLSYLNLSDNSITDIGGEYLLNTLHNFPLTFAELLASRSREMVHLKEKNERVMQIFKTLRAGEADKRTQQNNKRKTITPKPTSAKSRGLEPDASYKSLSNFTNNKFFSEKAIAMAENEIGPFVDPFDKANTTSKDGIVYCYGNNTLCNLNLAYNNLTFITAKNLLMVLKYQKEMARKPSGLIRLSIDGNYMPETCRELDQIQGIIDSSNYLQRKHSISKKRPPAKFTSPR